MTTRRKKRPSSIDDRRLKQLELTKATLEAVTAVIALADLLVRLLVK